MWPQLSPASRRRDTTADSATSSSSAVAANHQGRRHRPRRRPPFPTTTITNDCTNTVTSTTVIETNRCPNSSIGFGCQRSPMCRCHHHSQCAPEVVCHHRQSDDRREHEHEHEHVSAVPRVPIPSACDPDCNDSGVLNAGLRACSAAFGWGLRLRGVVLVFQAFLVMGVRRFLARFSGRRRSDIPFRHKWPPWRIFTLIIVYTSLLSIVDGCSSRTAPKPRPPPTPAAAATTARPNITFLTYECPPAYAAWYCLNGATCFTVKIGDSLLYNCECSEGYMGPRCEYKDLDGSYLPSQRRILLETASIAGGATIAALLVVVLGLVAYVHYCRRGRKELPPTPPPQLTCAHSTTLTTTTTDTVDGETRSVSRNVTTTQVPRRLPTFGTRWKTQNNQNNSVTRVDLQQVTTLLGDCDNTAQTQPTC